MRYLIKEMLGFIFKGAAQAFIFATVSDKNKFLKA
jgi:hypothetical protein